MILISLDYQHDMIRLTLRILYVYVGGWIFDINLMFMWVALFYELQGICLLKVFLIRMPLNFLLLYNSRVGGLFILDMNYDLALVTCVHELIIDFRGYNVTFYWEEATSRWRSLMLYSYLMWTLTCLSSCLCLLFFLWVSFMHCLLDYFLCRWYS